MRAFGTSSRESLERTLAEKQPKKDSGKSQIAARKACTKKNVQRTYQQKRQADSNKTWNCFRNGLDKIGDDPWACWSRLKKDGFCTSAQALFSLRGS